MSKVLQFAVTIVLALWFTSDAFPHKNKHSSNREEFDFYFVDKSVNEFTQHGNSVKNEATEFNKNDKHESIDKPYSEDDDEYFSVGKLKRLKLKRLGQVSDEFIDEYINPPTEKVLMEFYEVPVTNQPIFSNGKGNQALIPTKESSGEENVSKEGDRKLINPQNSDSDNSAIDMETALNNGVGKEEDMICFCVKINNTNHKTFSNQTGDINNKNVKEIAAVENEQNYFPSNKSPHFISHKPQNNKTSTSTSFSAEHTSKIANRNSSSSEETELSHSHEPNVASVRKNAYDRESRDQEFSNVSLESILQTDSDTDSDSSEYSDSDSDEYSDSDSDEYSDSDSDEYSDSDSSEYSDSDSSEYSDSDSSEYSDSDELYDYFEYDYSEYDDEDVQLTSNFDNYFTGTFSNAATQSPENFTAPFTNYSMEIESPTSSRNDNKINTLHKTEGPYNSILEFLYKHSKNTLIQKLKEENRGM